MDEGSQPIEEGRGGFDPGQADFKRGLGGKLLSDDLSTAKATMRGTFLHFFYGKVMNGFLDKLIQAQ
jgi:hypothetical protein